MCVFFDGQCEHRSESFIFILQSGRLLEECCVIFQIEMLSVLFE